MDLQIARQHIINLESEIFNLRSKIEYLEDRDILLSALEVAGVDNWYGYEGVINEIDL